MRKNTLVILAISSLALILTTQCGGDGVSTGSLNLAVTDAPVDSAAEVVVTFASASLQAMDVSTSPVTIPIPEEFQTVNLMAYQGTGHAALVSGLELPAGRYKVRLDPDLTFTDTEQKSWIAFDGESSECMDAPEGVVWAGTGSNTTCRYPLEIPSGDQSGFKPKGDVTILAGGTSSFTVEFDLRKNVVDPMNADIAYKLKPTGARLVDDNIMGAIEGFIDSDFMDSQCGSAQAHVYLFDRSDSMDPFVPDDIHVGNDSYVTSAKVQEVGSAEVPAYHYMIGYVSPGVYGVALTCGVDNPEVDDNLDFPTQADGITVNADETTIQDLPPLVAQGTGS